MSECGDIVSRRYFQFIVQFDLFEAFIRVIVCIWTCLPVKKIFNASFLWNSLDLTYAIIDTHQTAVCQFKEADSGGLNCIMLDTAHSIKVMSLLDQKWMEVNNQTSKYPGNFIVFFCPAPHTIHMWVWDIDLHNVLSLGNRLSLRALCRQLPLIGERLSEICGSEYWDNWD